MSNFDFEYTIFDDVVDDSHIEDTQSSGTSGNDNYDRGDKHHKILGKNGNDTINAGGGDDIVYAGNDDDRVEGNRGEDTILGESGNDKLFGNQGSDVISGGSGNDDIYGGEDQDELYGGHGNDSVEGGHGADTIYGGSGNDTLRGNDGDEVIYGGAHNDTIRGDDGHDYLDGGTGDDDIEGGTGQDEIYGGAGHDKINGGSSSDTIFGGDGHDTILGETGWDSIEGETGNDSIKGGEGEDTLEGGEGNDTLDGGHGDDTIYGGSGNDEISGSTSNDKLYGDEGNDTIRGEEGDDDIYGGAGDDEIWTGNGHDYVEGGAGHDFIDTGDAMDEVLGGAGDDTIKSGENDDVVYGGVGDDAIYGQDGDDTLIGGDGDDYIHGGFGRNEIVGGRGNDVMTSDTNIYGSSGNLARKSMVDYVYHEGNDRIQSLLHLRESGAESKDFYHEVDFRFIGLTRDQLDINKVSGSRYDVTFSDIAGSVRIGLYGHDQAVNTFNSNNYKVLNEDTVFSILEEDFRNIYGYDYEVHVLSDTADGFAYSGDAARLVNGLDGLDTISTGAGQDTVYGGGGNDVVSTGSGDDNIYGGDGTDVITGGAGDDRIFGQGGNTDTADESADKAVFSGNLAGYTIAEAGTDNPDFDYVITDTDTSDGDDGTDLLVGIEHLEFADVILGLTTNAVIGDATGNVIGDVFGDDKIAGGNGDDTITGGAGDDTINGGDGDDIAIYAGTFADYAITQNTDGTLTIADTVGTDGTDTVSNVEILRFADGDRNADDLSAVAGDLTIISATQSSTWGSLSADHAIDGVIGGSNTTATHNGANEWLSLDLGNDALIDFVTLHNRADQAGAVAERLNGAEVEVLNDGAVVWSSAEIAGAAQGSEHSLDTGGVVGDEVRITHEDQFLQLSEVDVLGTALTELAAVSATQSSTWGSLSADKAIDGIVGGDNTTATHNGANEWLSLDLGNDALIDFVTLHNRADQAGAVAERLNGAEIEILDDGLVVWSSAEISGAAQGSVHSLDTGGIVGDEVRITHEDQFLQLSEVDVLGTALTELTAVSATQSSTYNGEAAYAADSAVDGVIGGTNFNHTSNSGSQWLSLDLGADDTIEFITVHNRADGNSTVGGRLNGAAVEVLDDGAVVWSGTVSGALQGSQHDFDTGGVVGDEVRISHEDQWLHVSEVDVFSFA